MDGQKPDSRADGWKVLREGPRDSVKRTWPVAAVFSGASATLAAAWIASKGLSAGHIAWCVAVPLLVTVTVYVGFEVDRLRRCRFALEGLLNDEKFYEQLLDEARRELAQVKVERITALAQGRIMMHGEVIAEEVRQFVSDQLEKTEDR